MITSQQKKLVKATVPILKEHGVLLTTYFYKRMFEHNPELKHVFNIANQHNGKQQTALAMAVLAYAEHIENPEVLLPVLDHIGQKHTSLSIRPEHYQIVGKHLLASIAEVLGETATAELLKAWEVAYFQLAGLMSSHESSLYIQQVQKAGGWSGWRPFLVKNKVVESAEITSFYLYPADHGEVADFVPGQYVSIRLFLPEINLLQPRQYSISSGPNGQYYRISVKREAGIQDTPEGMISNHLHQNIHIGDLIDVSAPAGNFFLKDHNGPVVFISGGVGQTPLLSMLENLVKGGQRQGTWIHGCRDKNVHAFKEDVEKWTAENPHIQKHIFYNNIGSETDLENHYEGWVDLNKLEKDIHTDQTVYYVCGPVPFIEKQYKDLINIGVSKSSIYFEEFGPQTLQLI